VRKIIIPSLILQKKRERKRNNQLTRLRRENNGKIKIKTENIKENIEINECFISNEIKHSNKFIKTRDVIKRKFTLPSNFDIISNPEGVLIAINKIIDILLCKKIKKLNLSHAKVKKTSLGSESLLGLVVSELVLTKHDKKDLQVDNFTISGKLPKNNSDAIQLILSIGLIEELTKRLSRETNNVHDKNIHLFLDSSKPEQNSGLKVDQKAKTSKDCVDYLERCLNSHELTLSEEIQFKLKACLGEIIDNADEHSNRTKSNWIIRGYFNNTESPKNRYLELSVFNFGNSIIENFNELNENSKAKQNALRYVDKHKNKVSSDCLYSIHALQGSVSTKKDDEPTRGQGTVTLIETFELLYRDYCKLRDSNSDVNVEMNIISGRSVINFDGQYKSSTKINDDGSETFEMPFNKENSLSFPPDERITKKMNGISFPGVMINIRIPLQGNDKSPVETV